MAADVVCWRRGQKPSMRTVYGSAGRGVDERREGKSLRSGSLKNPGRARGHLPRTARAPTIARVTLVAAGSLSRCSRRPTHCIFVFTSLVNDSSTLFVRWRFIDCAHAPSRLWDKGSALCWICAFEPGTQGTRPCISTCVYTCTFSDMPSSSVHVRCGLMGQVIKAARPHKFGPIDMWTSWE